MIVEWLFMEKDVELALKESFCESREFSVVEENVIYYAAGYVIQKLIKKFTQSSNNDACVYVGALLHMVGEDTSGALVQSDTYLEYVKVWPNNTDRGGLRHASDDTYRFFPAMETRVYELIKSGGNKDKVVSETIDDENLIFLWEVAADMSHGTQLSKLLQKVVELWYAIRGFCITSKLLEQYKKATKTTTKGRKGIRKELY